MENIKLLYIDLFCGAGGTSTGVESARLGGEKCARVIACVNHDAGAIASHAANHPNALHFTEDIRTLELSPLVAHAETMKASFPEALAVLWASLECTNFSKAKGGKPRDADSRTLAEHLFRYIEAIRPDYVQIENVEEFMCWGDLDVNGKPISKNRGVRYLRWLERVKGYGYDFEHRILNAADYGAYTSRKRFFGIFAKQGLPIVFPVPTHAKNVEKSQENLFSRDMDVLHKWKPVKDVLDFSDEGKSIFTRKKPLSDKTLDRIYAGLIKFVAGGKDDFLSAYYGITRNFNRTYEQTAKSTDEPCGVVTTENRFAKVQAKFLPQNKWLLKYNSLNGTTGRHIPPSVDEPCPVVSCQGRLGIIRAKFLSKYYGHPLNQEANAVSIESPAPTLTVKDRLSLISPNFIVNNYSGGGQDSDINRPCPAIMTSPKQNIVQCKFVDQQYGNSKPSELSKPLGCITSNPKYNIVSCFLMNPQYCSNGGSVENPCFTLIARMDKQPPYLVATKTGQMAIEVYETDSEPLRKIKEFMALYEIVDIKMRMLKIPELKQIMGFPEDYTLIGTQAEQKKYIGNAVEVNMARVLCEALVEQLTINL
jgi:DNA (cytosine-5)-methyltransferase 1